jgi:hypothetical protein
MFSDAGCRNSHASKIIRIIFTIVRDVYRSRYDLPGVTLKISKTTLNKKNKPDNNIIIRLISIISLPVIKIAGTFMIQRLTTKTKSLL